MGQKTRTYANLSQDLINSYLAVPDDLSKEEYPLLQNLSAAFIFNCLPVPSSEEQPEYIYVDFEDMQNSNKIQEVRVFISQWNFAWESGSYRHDLFRQDIPKELSWLSSFSGKNIYLKGVKTIGA